MALMDVEKENTARALKELPLLATRQWHCRFGIHTWLKWDNPISRRLGTYSCILQFRECACCGKVKMRTISKD